MYYMTVSFFLLMNQITLFSLTTKIMPVSSFAFVTDCRQLVMPRKRQRRGRKRDPPATADDPFRLAQEARCFLKSRLGADVASLLFQYLRPKNVDLCHITQICESEMLILLPDAPSSAISDNQSMTAAASIGALSMVRWLHYHRRVKCRKLAMGTAAANGHLLIVKWLHHHRKEGCTKYAMDYAAANGHLSVVKWLHNNRHEGCTTRAMDLAAQHGYLHIVQWLHIHGKACTEEAMNRAATNGHLQVVKWLHKHRSEGCSSDAVNGAAINRHFHVLRWLYANQKATWTTLGMVYILEKGDLAVLKWMYPRYGKDLKDFLVDMFGIAAKHGHLHILQWLHDNHLCGGSGSAIYYCTREGNLEILEWIVRNRSDAWIHVGNAIWMATRFGHVHILKFLFHHIGKERARARFGAELDYAREMGDLRAADLLRHMLDG